MNIGPLLDAKLSVKYSSGHDEAERRKKKRKEKFQGQVAKAVKRMQVKLSPLNCCNKFNSILKLQEKHTLQYVAGRRYEKTDSKKYLREDRDRGVPSSFAKLNMFLKERRLEICDFVGATEETERRGGGAHLPNLPNGAVLPDQPLEEDLEVGPEDVIGDSADEEEIIDGEDDGNDSE